MLNTYFGAALLCNKHSISIFAPLLGATLESISLLIYEQNMKCWPSVSRLTASRRKCRRGATCHCRMKATFSYVAVVPHFGHATSQWRIFSIFVLNCIRSTYVIETYFKVQHKWLSTLKKYHGDLIGLHTVFSSFSYNFMHNFSYMKICRLLFFK